MASAGSGPRIDIKNEKYFYAIKLAKEGFYGGNPEDVLKAPVTSVIHILNYEAFEADYQSELERQYKEAQDENR